MRFIKNIFRGFTKAFFISLPWIFLISGFGLLAIGTFIKFPDVRLNEFFSGSGKSILAGGVLTLLLKSMQFMGIIREELSKIVSDSDYLENRNDLAEYWGRVTRVLFQDKFPSINTHITDDIKETYLPTKLIHYYENCSDIINIKLTDPTNDKVSVVQNTAFHLIPSSAHKEFKHPYTNRITKGNSGNVSTFSLDYIKINGEEIDKDKEIDYKQVDGDECLSSSFVLDVKGAKEYFIEYQVSKTYSLKDDNVIGFKNSFIHHNYRVQIFLNDIAVDFYEAGTISKFKTIHENENYIEKQFSGLLYKGQGFIVFLKKK